MSEFEFANVVDALNDTIFDDDATHNQIVEMLVNVVNNKHLIITKRDNEFVAFCCFAIHQLTTFDYVARDDELCDELLSFYGV